MKHNSHRLCMGQHRQTNTRENLSTVIEAKVLHRDFYLIRKEYNTTEQLETLNPTV